MIYLKHEDLKGVCHMAVENKRMIDKMMNELQQAKDLQHDPIKMKRHIAKVQVLCEVMLEESSTTNTEKGISDHELKAMIGKQQSQKEQVNTQKVNMYSKTDIYDEDTNDDSLFDF